MRLKLIERHVHLSDGHAAFFFLSLRNSAKPLQTKGLINIPNLD